jgi:hypothetical protein
MSIGLAAPLALAALAALVVPIVLHLVRRAEQRDTPFAALRFLRPAGLPRRRIRVAEPGLLLLRCLLLARARGDARDAVPDARAAGPARRRDRGARDRRAGARRGPDGRDQRARLARGRIPDGGTAG